MEDIISISEIIGTIDDGAVEVCATCEASYEEAGGKAEVWLGALARRTIVTAGGDLVQAAWLPRPERVAEHLPREEVDAFARDVFAAWVRKVRAAVPVERGLRT